MHKSYNIGQLDEAGYRNGLSKFVINYPDAADEFKQRCDYRTFDQYAIDIYKSRRQEDIAFAWLQKHRFFEHIYGRDVVLERFGINLTGLPIIHATHQEFKKPDVKVTHTDSSLLTYADIKVNGVCDWKYTLKVGDIKGYLKHWVPTALVLFGTTNGVYTRVGIITCEMMGVIIQHLNTGELSAGKGSARETGNKDCIQLKMPEAPKDRLRTWATDASKYVKFVEMPQ